LANSCLKKIKEHKRIKDDIELKQIFRYGRHFLIRRFLNDLMVNYENHKEEKTNKKIEDFNEEIETCCRENLVYLFEIFH